MLAIQLLISALIILGVLWFMWKLPRRGEALFGWAPPLALLSAWLGLAGVATSLLLWLLPTPDRWIAVVFLLLDPAALAAGILVLWIYRGMDSHTEAVAMQRIQAKVGIGLGLLAVAIGYAFVMTHKAVFTPVGQ